MYIYIYIYIYIQCSLLYCYEVLELTRARVVQLLHVSVVYIANITLFPLGLRRCP